MVGLFHFWEVLPGIEWGHLPLRSSG
ncbi:hypothetical protein SAMN06298212_1011, partial [Ruaniaceae bacterium KH17]